MVSDSGPVALASGPQLVTTAVYPSAVTLIGPTPGAYQVVRLSSLAMTGLTAAASSLDAAFVTSVKTIDFSTERTIRT